jgi:hypothetical protein
MQCNGITDIKIKLRQMASYMLIPADNDRQENEIYGPPTIDVPEEVRHVWLSTGTPLRPRPGLQGLFGLAADLGLPLLLLTTCLQHFLDYLEPIIPVVERSFLHGVLQQQDHVSVVEECLILSTCAITILRTPVFDLPLGSARMLARSLLEHVETLIQRSEIVSGYSDSLATTQYLSSICYLDLQDKQASEKHLRNAIHNLQSVGHAHDLSAFTSPSISCLKLLLYIHDVSSSIRGGREFLMEDQEAALQVVAKEHASEHVDDLRQLYLTHRQLRFNLQQAQSEQYDTASEIERHYRNQQLDLTGTYRSDVAVAVCWSRLVTWQQLQGEVVTSGVPERSGLSRKFTVNVARTMTTALLRWRVEAFRLHGVPMVSSCCLP